MKKVIILLLVIFLAGCSYSRGDIPKGFYDGQISSKSIGFDDYIEYGKYMYKSKDKVLKDSEYKKISEEETGNIIEYFIDFENAIESLDAINEYDFDKSMINYGAYVKIVTKEGKSIGNSTYGKYDNYSIYFFDIETLTLYYIHTNI